MEVRGGRAHSCQPLVIEGGAYHSGRPGLQDGAQRGRSSGGTCTPHTFPSHPHHSHLLPHSPLSSSVHHSPEQPPGAWARVDLSDLSLFLCLLHELQLRGEGSGPGRPEVVVYLLQQRPSNGSGGVRRREEGKVREEGGSVVIVYVHVHVDHLPSILSSILIHVGLLLCYKIYFSNPLKLLQIYFSKSLRLLEISSFLSH